MIGILFVASALISIVTGQSVANICTGLEDQTLVRNVQDCSKYFHCFNGTPMPMSCGEGELFDHIIGACDNRTTLDECFKCPASSFIDIAVPNQCNQFVRCFNLIPEQHTCADGLFFDPSVGMCNIRDNVKCVYTVECPLRQSEHPWFVRDRLNCANYYICLYGQPEKHSCPKDLYFNTVTSQCDYPEHTNCVINRKTKFLLGYDEE